MSESHLRQTSCGQTVARFSVDQLQILYYLILCSKVLSKSASSFFKFCVTSHRLSKDISTVIVKKFS